MIGYSFDTSSLLNGRRDLFRPTVFKSLWTNIENLIADGTVRCVDEVKEELGRKDDEVQAWAVGQPRLFLPLTSDIQDATRDLLRRHPKMLGRGGGRNGADPFVIVLAVVAGGTVVTEETMSGNVDRPRIPDVCEATGTPWTNLAGFIEAQGWSF